MSDSDQACAITCDHDACKEENEKKKLRDDLVNWGNAVCITH